MTTIYPGTTHPEVGVARAHLEHAGYSLVYESPRYYSGLLEPVVRAMQEDCGLTVDGIIGPKTWAALEALPKGAPCTLPVTRAEYRLTAAMGLLDNADLVGFRYGKVASVKVWQEMQDGTRTGYVVPRVTATGQLEGKRVHGCTCGHWTWLLTAFWCGQERPTWRTGRNGRWIWTFSESGEWVANGRKVAASTPGAALCKGFAEHVARSEHIPAGKGLGELYRLALPGNLCIIEYPSHVACAVRLDASLNIIDPRTSLPARHGWYRVAADGSSNPWMERFTFRRIRETETGGGQRCWLANIGVPCVGDAPGMEVE